MPRKRETARAPARTREGKAPKVAKSEKPPPAASEAGPKGVVSQQYELAPVDALRPHPLNANEGDLESIEESVEENGFYGAVIVQRSTGLILVGNHRWRAARAKGLATLPAIYVDVDDAHAKRILLADNATRRKAKTHEERVADILASLPSVRGTGYTVADAQAIVARARPRLDYLDRIGAGAAPEDDEELVSGATEFPSSKDDAGDGDGDRAGRKDRFPLPIVLSSAEMRRWQEFKRRVGMAKDKAAFLALLEAAAR